MGKRLCREARAKQGRSRLTEKLRRYHCGAISFKSQKRGVQAARNGPSLPPCVAKAEMSMADRLGVLVGYQWSHTGLYPGCRPVITATSAASCRTPKLFRPWIPSSARGIDGGPRHPGIAGSPKRSFSQLARCLAPIECLANPGKGGKIESGNPKRSPVCTQASCAFVDFTFPAA